MLPEAIARLRENENLEDAPTAMLKHLGELKRPYLTAIVKKLLSVIEKEYGIIDEIPRNFQSTKD
ncbi:MAG: hypothetical protein RM347_031680 [Nostoc sp. ChiQUE02]|uniref:hypothetical protein n=1 Tax=Nostoc sp. ChiQUE02 TaxID=3075377 RepID=UPI002AD2D0C3|nr:hypothetical protein [Nostoc sp. ChiQUE02]MDZ8228384.1 hypothetical protein [Nostoc sp. ChiQUE02]